MSKILSILSLLILGLVVAGCGETTTKDNRPTLKVGMECAYAPFNWTETKKSDTNVPISNFMGAYAEGYDVQMAKLIADALDMKLEVYAIEWGGLIEALNTNQIDLVIAGMSPTAERKETIDFTDKYYSGHHVFVVAANSELANATSFDAFVGKKVSGQTGTIYADLATQAVEKGMVAATNKDTVSQIVLDINNSLVDATIVEYPVALGLCANNSNLKYVDLGSNVFDVNEEDIIVSIGLRKNYELTSQINAVLANISETQRQELMNNAVNNAPAA